MRITIETTIDVTPECEEDMGTEEEKFLQEQIKMIFQEQPHFIRKRSITMRKPFSSETMNMEIEIIDSKETKFKKTSPRFP